MSDAEKRRFDGLRREYHDSFGPVLTEPMGRLYKFLMDRAVSNLSGPPGARPGAVIDGPANVGKSTILTEFGRSYERVLRRRYGERMLEHGVAEWHPVVYNSLSARTTVKALNMGLANFYGVTFPRYDATTHRLTRMVVECAQRCATTLFLIDDIHYLDMKHHSAREVNNHLKQLMNETSATFVYAGVGLEETGLFTEGQPNGRLALGQTRNRFARFPLEPFQTSARARGDEWHRLVAAFEAGLVLRKARKGMLTGMRYYLYKRTDGYVGALSNLLKLGAAKAIETGEERITRELLRGVRIDEASQDAWREHLGEVNGSR
jgi:hypothetical protein